MLNNLGVHGIPIIESSEMIETKVRWVRVRRSWCERIRRPGRCRIKYKPAKEYYKVPRRDVLYVPGTGIGGTGGYIIAHPAAVVELKAELLGLEK